VSAPGEHGDREVPVDATALGIAYSVHDLTVFLQGAGLVGLDEVDVADSDLIEWHGGGPTCGQRHRRAGRGPLALGLPGCALAGARRVYARRSAPMTARP
jgi:hypothetical protein